MNSSFFFCFNDTSTTEIYKYSPTLSLHDALPISTLSNRTTTPKRHYSKRYRHVKTTFSLAHEERMTINTSSSLPVQPLKCVIRHTVYWRTVDGDRKSTRLNSSH